jgi:hypothetical protein
MERIAACACGKVRIAASGPPTASAVCYCDDCQAGGRQLEAAGAQHDFRDAWGGTEYASYADARLHVVDGQSLLRGYKLREAAPTTRYMTTCCNSAMLLKFANGWWTSLYRIRLGDEAPPLQMRTNVTCAADPAAVPKDVPHASGFPARLLLRLVAGGIRTGFRRARYG